MSDQVLTVTVKGIGDFSDVVSNVGSVQKALTKLKLPDKLGDNLNKNITAFYKEYDKYQQKIAGGLKTQGDYNQVEKSLNTMRNLYQAIGADAQKLLKLDMKDLLNLDTGEFKTISDDIANIMKQIGNTKIDTTPFTKAINDIRGVTKNSKISGENGLLNQILGNVKSGQIEKAKEALQELKNYADKVAPRQTASGNRMPGTLSVDKYNQLTSAIDIMNGAVARAEATMDPLIQKQNDLQRELEETKQKAVSGIEKEFKGYNEASQDVERVTDSLKKMHQEEFNFNREAQNIDRQIQSYFGLSQMIRKVGDIARDAFATVKDLDKAMTETAVVTNFSVGDMWDMLPTYTAQANQLGSTIKDVYEAATLYYQQGLNTNQAMGLANETLKMARIAGLDATEATNMMTAALRGFNMEVNQTSAQKINDIYSELAAITASDTKEIGSAMERTASIANAANMDFATTSAFLAQMIETTREAPENLGTAMKTIVARFQEMKQDPTKLVDSEGVAMDVNKVDKALKTIGVSLTNTKGEFRDLDDVFLDISAKWDSLSQGQQRYIATIAAGSRQQSRFIAMMSNYERTMELVDAANNSAGASQRQFEKTLDSMAAKLNMLKNAWDQFTMGLMNNQILKFGVDALTEGFTIVNKFIDALSKLGKPFGLEGLNKSLLTLVTTLSMLNFGKKATRGLVMGGAGWWKGETSLTEGFKQGWESSGQTGFFANRKNNQAEQQGMVDGQAYGRGWAKAVQAIQTKQQTGKGIFRQTLDTLQQNKNIFGSDKNIVSQLFPAGGLSDEAQRDAEDYINTLRQELANKKITKEQLPVLIESGLGQTTGFSDQNLDAVVKDFDAKKVKSIGTGFTGLTTKINSAGVALSNFGAILQGTPLEPFGQILNTVGGALISLSTVVATTKASFLEQWAAATAAAMGTEAEGVAAMTAAAANGTLTVSSITAAGGMATLGAAIWAALWPLLVIAAAIAAVVVIAKGLDAAIETNKEKLENASNAAAAASEAYDSAKQETSELADSIAQIEETDAAFDNLVAGTAEFNEQLVTANEQITELIDKYPMLNDPRYLSTDKNGRMRINQAGLDAVKEYQKQIQANASAMNLIQTADLNAVENQQKADELRKPKGDMTTDELEKNRKQADLLEQRVEAETQLARQNAIRVSLADKEIHNAETMSKIMADQYETKKESAKLDVEAMSKHERRQAYADYHGYTYDKSTKKIKDVEGNEVDYDDEAIKDEVIEQQVILEFQEDAESLERALSSVNSKFASGLEEQTAGSAHVISDILSNNIETDEEMLRKVLSEPNQLQNLVDNLSEAEMAAILGISTSSITDKTIDKYKTDIVNKLTGNAEKIAEAQAESYSDLAAMMAKAQGNILDKDGDIIGQNGKTNKQIEQAISKQINDLKPEYAHLMSSVGSQLQEFAGEDTMAAFVNKAYDIYTAKGKNAGQTISELNHLIDNTNFDSAISRLSFYNQAIQSENKSIQNLGQTMKATTGEANLLGQAFDEFLGSSDWAELSENADDFKNALGEYDAAGIQKAAEQSRTLNELLDSGAISAGGVAAALQGMDDGTITNLNSTVLTLLSSFNRLSDAASEAHKIIEGFDPGIDTGEGEDFVKENAEKFKEYYNNGEFGNEQLQNYIKLAAGTDKWNEALRKNGGNLRDTAEQLKYYVTAFDDGFVSVYDKLTKGLDLQGNSISEDVKKEFEGLEFLWDDNGELQINLADFGTEELQTYLQKALGISEDYAKLMLQNLANYDTELSAQLRANDIKNSLSNKEFQDSHRDSQGKFILSDSDIRAVGASLDLENDINTKEGLEEATQAIEKLANTELEVFRTQNEDGSQREDYSQLLADYAKTFYGQNVEDLFSVQELQQGGKFDVGKLINDSIAKGMDSNQASQTAYEAIQKASAEGITDLLYNGQLLDLSEINSYEDFLAATQKLTDSAQWYEVGQSIAEGIISYIEGKDNNNNNNNNDTQGEQKNGEDKKDKESQKPAGMPESDGRKQQGNQAVERQPLQKLWDLFIKGPQTEYQARQEQGATGKSAEQLQADNKAFWSNLISNSDRAAAAREQKLTAGIQQNQLRNDTASTDASAAAADTSAAADNTTNAATALNTAATQLSAAATALNGAANKLNQGNNGNINNTVPSAPIKQYAPGAPSNIPQNQNLSQKGTIEVDNADANAKLNETKELAIQTRDTINQGASFIIKTPGVKNLNKAAASAQKITDNQGDKSINIQANASGTDETNKLSSAVSNFRKLDSKTVKLKADTSGLVGTVALTAAVRAFHGYSDKTITLKTITVKETINKDATGEHNHGYAPAPPKAGSAARGSYGQVGPRGKGGMTLTGELGYEIAWLPDENRSMILGANGPQMINLPGNAVVWTHEQSKKIMKQKAIPAGSHSKKANTSIKRPGGSGGGSTGSSSKKSKKSSKKSSKKGDSSASNNWSIEEVVRFDIDKKLETLASKIKKATDDIDKKLGKIGLKASGIAKDTQAQVKNLQSVKNYNDNLVKSYQKDLNKLAGGPYNTKISYSTGSGKKSKSKEETVNLASYIYRDRNGDYQIDRNAIARAGSVAKQEAIFKAAESALNPLVSGLQKAKDAAADAQKQMDELGKKVSETFYQWENEITEVYNLTQRISHDESLRARFSAQVALQLSKLKAGFGDTAQSINIMHQALERDNKILLEQIENQQKMIGARQRELNAALSAQDELDELNRLRAKAYDTAATKNATIAWATDNYEGARLGRNYLNNVRQDRDGSLRYDIDWERFNKDRQADPYNKNTYEAIKKYLDELNSATDEFNKSIQEQTNLIKETYDALKEYQDYVADFEDTLLKGFEEEIENNIENSKKISESISNTLKDLLDQVKRKLDERRQQEDNRKTEDDISRKQQRLAMLRADTSGSHAAEIAQLESEIADSQQSYQRTLEDQLLDKLQQQGDEAAKQRERQIEIAQAQLEVATNGNSAIVDLWLRDPEAYKEEIKKAWLEAQGYDEKGEAGQYILANQFESEFANLVTAISQSGFFNGFKAVSDDTSTLVSLLTQLTEGRDALTDNLSKAVGALQDVENRDTQSFELGKRAQQSAAQWKQEGFNASSLKNWGYTFDELKNSGFSNTELRDAGFGIKDFISHGTTNPKELHDLGFTAKEITDELGLQLKDLVADPALWSAIPWSQVSKGNYSLDDYVNAGITDAASLRKANFSLTELASNKTAWNANSWKAIKNAGYTASDYKKAKLSFSNGISSGFSIADLKAAGYTYQEARKAGYNARQLYNAGYSEATKELWPYGKVSETSGKIKPGAKGANVKALQFALNQILGTKLAIDGNYGPQTKSAVAAFEKKVYKHQGDLIVGPQDKAWFKKYGYKTGGLANFTGPAWLDGTPSKPELVLNATDTKNFIALKDVLAHAMGSTDQIDNSSGGNATYEININVDHLNNDYDVDKVVERVKKKIVQDAGYRNVTQVRKFR